MATRKGATKTLNGRKYRWNGRRWVADTRKPSSNNTTSSESRRSSQSSRSNRVTNASQRTNTGSARVTGGSRTQRALPPGRRGGSLARTNRGQRLLKGSPNRPALPPAKGNRLRITGKGVRNTALGGVGAAADYANRRASGQSQVQSVAGAGGGWAGMAAGANRGAWLGAKTGLPGGARVGAALGGVAGYVGGSQLADSLTGVNKPRRSGGEGSRTQAQSRRDRRRSRTARSGETRLQNTGKGKGGAKPSPTPAASTGGKGGKGGKGGSSSANGGGQTTTTRRSSAPARPARKPQSKDMAANYRAWAKANPKLAKKLKPGQAGYKELYGSRRKGSGRRRGGDGIG